MQKPILILSLPLVSAWQSDLWVQREAHTEHCLGVVRSNACAEIALRTARCGQALDDKDEGDDGDDDGSGDISQ